MQNNTSGESTLMTVSIIAYCGRVFLMNICVCPCLKPAVPGISVLCPVQGGEAEGSRGSKSFARYCRSHGTKKMEEA